MTSTNSFDEQMRAVGAYRSHLARNERHARALLAEAADSIAERMTNTARQLRGPGDAIINALGELQAQGTQFDAACARYATYRQARRDFDSFVEETS